MKSPQQQEIVLVESRHQRSAKCKAARVAGGSKSRLLKLSESVAGALALCDSHVDHVFVKWIGVRLGLRVED